MAKSNKTVCSISRQQFMETAKPVNVTINGHTITGDGREFKTGSFGWYVNGKVTHSCGSKEAFLQTPITVSIDGQSFVAEPRQFSTGSMGWYLSGKAKVQGLPCQVSGNAIIVGSKGGDVTDQRVQVGLNITVIGSKEAAKPVAKQPVASQAVVQPEVKLARKPYVCPF